jgi:hypothetical protein
MRYLALGLMLALGLVWLGFHAAGDDDYYPSGEVSRWDHATDTGAVPIVIAAAVIASAIALAFLFRGLSPTRLALGRFAIPAVVVYVPSFGVAWFFLNVGH